MSNQVIGSTWRVEERKTGWRWDERGIEKGQAGLVLVFEDAGQRVPAKPQKNHPKMLEAYETRLPGEGNK